LSEPIDLLIHPRWTVTVEPAGAALEDHAVAVRDGRIVAVVPMDEARIRFQPGKTVERPKHVLIPVRGNLHAHAAMNLRRGIADDLPLMRWLQEAIWPTESRHVSAAFVRDGTLLAAAEMLRGGITTCNDMYFYPGAAAEAFAEAGMRAVVGIVVLDFPTPWASDADDYLRKGLHARDRFANHPLLSFSVAPHAPYTVSDTAFEHVRALADELETGIHVHVHETETEIRESLTTHGVRPLTRLARLGVLGESTIGVHAVHLSDMDVELLARHGGSVAHCPTSNMKLGSGIAPVTRLLAAGVNTGLGTDGAASNNRVDLFQEMRHAALLAKATTLDAAALPAHRALAIATIDGARALGMAALIGSITPGKQAALFAVDFGGLFTQPCFDPVSHLVYSAGREHVTHVWVNGEPRVNKGVPLLHIHDKELLRIASLWQTRLAN